MKNCNRRLIVLTVLMSGSIVSMERPPQPPQLPMPEQTPEEFAQLQRTVSGKVQPGEISFPPDIRRMLLSLTGKALAKDLVARYRKAEFPNMVILANRIYARAGIITADVLIDIFELLPYTANALYLADLLREKYSMQPLLWEGKVIEWLRQARARLEDSDDLETTFLDEIEFNDLPEDEQGLYPLLSASEQVRQLQDLLQNRNLAIDTVARVGEETRFIDKIRFKR